MESSSGAEGSWDDNGFVAGGFESAVFEGPDVSADSADVTASQESTSASQESQEVDDRKRALGKREFCANCCKAASRCICGLITSRVNNRTKITILQHPVETNHHLGTARIAVVGLQNVELIHVPQVKQLVCTRVRPKVPGSKRQIAGRGGKKAALANLNKKGEQIIFGEPKAQTVATIQVKQVSSSLNSRLTGDSQVMKMATLGTKPLEPGFIAIVSPPWITLESDAGLLFPSEHAIDLIPASKDVRAAGGNHSPGVKFPSQLIVLDGTWSKAKRIFYENTWLQSLPHYRLPYSEDLSRYGILRKEPKQGCMSTIESVVLALKTVEPELEGLDSLLRVFDVMIEDQIRCMGDKYDVLEEKVRNALKLKSKSNLKTVKYSNFEP